MKTSSCFILNVDPQYQLSQQETVKSANWDAVSQQQTCPSTKPRPSWGAGQCLFFWVHASVVTWANLCVWKAARVAKGLEIMALEVGQVRGNNFVLVFLPEKGRLKVKLENCLQKHKKQRQRRITVFYMSTGDDAHKAVLSTPDFFLKEKQMPIQSDRKRICWTAVCYTFCLHLLVYCGLVTELFFPSFLLGSPFKSGSYFVITSDG